MAEGIGRVAGIRAAPAWGTSILAGAGAGVIAGIACVGLEILMHAQAPPRAATFWSAFVAGVLGGILYGLLGRFVRRPVSALWVTTLGIATIDSLLIGILPGPSGRGPTLWIPIVGLTVPLRQLLALAGIGHFGTRHFPASYLPAVTIVHYVTAVAVSLLVPWWAKLRGPMGGADP